MPGWADLQDELNRIEPDKRGDHVAERLRESAKLISQHCGRNVLYYASSFLQKPHVPGLFTSLNMEDINGFMAGIHGHDFSKGLLLVLHTPGGMAEAAQTVVDYLRSKFADIDVLIPTYAMSAGTMIALACDKIIMGRQSQLGPTLSLLSGVDHSRHIRSLSSSKRRNPRSRAIRYWPMRGHQCCGRLALHCCRKPESQSRMDRVLYGAGYTVTCSLADPIRRPWPMRLPNTSEATSTVVTEGESIATRQGTIGLQLSTSKTISIFRNRS